MQEYKGLAGYDLTLPDMIVIFGRQFETLKHQCEEGAGDEGGLKIFIEVVDFLLKIFFH